MARLIVDQIVCVEETNELGSDDVYMIVFRGNTTKPFDSNVEVYGPGNFWDDFDTGEAWDQDIVVAKYHPDAVYLAMLVEKDNDRDINGAEVLGTYKSTTAAAWKLQMATLLGLSPGPASENQRAQAAAAISEGLLGLATAYMDFPKGNDDRIGRPQRITVHPGQGSKLYEFKGDGGHYKVRFKVA